MFVCLSTGLRYCKSNQSILLKIDVVIGPTDVKNQSSFNANPVPDTDFGSGSLFHFLQHRRIGNFRSFISISHIVISHFSRNSAKWLRADKGVNLLHFGNGYQNMDQPEIGFRIPNHFWLRQPKSKGEMHLALAEVCALGVLSSFFSFWSRSVD